MVKFRKKKDQPKDLKLVAAEVGKADENKLEEIREEALATGRKFKYPIQYAKHKVVINAIVISVLALAALTGFTYMGLYRWQDTGDILYRVTQVLPLPVASVDGFNVRFSDYLMQYRSSVMAIEQLEGKLEDTEDNQRRLDYYKREALNNAILNSFALKLAKENDIFISSERIDEVFNEHRRSGEKELTEEQFLQTIHNNYGFSRSEYERLFIELPLIRQEVQVKIDSRAAETLKKLLSSISEHGFDDTFNNLADRGFAGGSVVPETSGGLVGNRNLDGGRASAAFAQSVDAVSEPFLSRAGDGYYIVKTLNKSEDRVEYASLKVPFTELATQLKELKEQGKVKEYIGPLLKLK